MITERPKCNIENCNGEALVLFSGMLICGNCFSKYYFENEKRKREEINKIINEDINATL